VSRLTRLVAWFDAFQQRHVLLAFPIGVVKKYGDDKGGYLAALFAYYGFLSLFPLLLLMVTVLGIVLSGNPDLQARIVDSALGQFPIIGQQLEDNVNAIQGNNLALIVGIVGSLWGAFGVTQALQNAFDDTWEVPRRGRSNFFFSKLRGLLMLLALVAFIGGSTVLTAVGTSFAAVGFLARALSTVGTFVLSFALYAAAFKVLTARDLGLKDILPGSVVAAVGWTVLQVIGGYLVQHQIKNATALYGFFGIVLGMLFWIYLIAQVTVYASEINVVMAGHRWPRSLTDPPPEATPAGAEGR
jgi:YihY family inner membrane protein